MTLVKLLRQQKTIVLIEWQDEAHNLYRSVVPTESLVKTDSGFTHENPQMGVPYGIDWGLVDIVPITSTALGVALHNAGIFTLEELQDNLNTAKGILLGLSGVTVNKLVHFAIKSSKVTGE